MKKVNLVTHNGELFTVQGDNAVLALKGLLINAASLGGEGSLHGCASARGAMNKIIVDDCVRFGCRSPSVLYYGYTN